MKKQNSVLSALAMEAEKIMALRVAHRVNRLGGYGPESEVIYEGHPMNCPSVLVDSKGAATATFMSNGSVDFMVKLPEGMEVKVLNGHFDPVEKRETGAPSSNIWIDLKAGKQRHVASLLNPNSHQECPADRIKVVKLGDPARAMWYCAWFSPAPGVKVATAVRMSMRSTAQGPELVREVCIRNLGRKPVVGSLWTCYMLHGTQRFVYNKELWYDAGAPVSLADTVMTARVPYSDIIQIKRLHSAPVNLRPLDATCDYAAFVGDTAAHAALPAAVRQGRMLRGAGRKLNRFATAAVGANQFGYRLAPGAEATLCQTLLYVTDQAVCDEFRKLSGYTEPTYQAQTRSFAKACRALLRQTGGTTGESAATQRANAAHGPSFELQLPTERAVSEYANSVWTGVKELYENCRAHGAKLADGIELGTRDRGQDMWPKIKEDPGRVRADLVHALSFMYVTHTGPFPTDRPLSRREKLHGMFPRQYPSHWNNRTLPVRNDNRPYTDSPVWLVNSLNMYIRETGDIDVLLEQVKTIRLTDPDTPETSAIIGHEQTLRVVEVVAEIFACFERHASDSPYGMTQILYGDWCDPIDMFGTSVVGDARTRGCGRGVQSRLSAHVFLAAVETLDTLESRQVAESLARQGVNFNAAKLKAFADRLRQNIVKTAWEDGGPAFPAGFLNCIHELNIDGTKPDYARGETGYTLGSMKGRDFDGINRRELASQAFCLEMLLTQRPYLTELPETAQIVPRLLRAVDKLFYSPKLGLTMFTKPIANNQFSIEKCGRMGVLPVGTAENGEYHHCQVFMHRYRLSLPGETDTVWRQFKPMMSALRDESLAGPFETPCTSYVSDKHDPHFGQGMYFGLSGSVDWIVEIFHKISGITFALHDPDKPAIRVEPNLPAALNDQLLFRRLVHVHAGAKGYRSIPLQVEVRREGRGSRLVETVVRVNGARTEKPEIWQLEGLDRVELEIVRIYG